MSLPGTRDRYLKKIEEVYDGMQNNVLCVHEKP